MAVVLLDYSTAAGSSEGRERKGKNPTEGFGIFSTVSPPSRRWVREPAKRCCNCTRHSTCSTAVPPVDSALGAHWGRLMQSPTTTRVILGHFPRGADPPSADQRASPPTVQSPKYSTSQRISADEAGGGSARGGAGGRRSPQDGGGGVGGEANVTRTVGEILEAQRGGRGEGLRRQQRQQQRRQDSRDN